MTAASARHASGRQYGHRVVRLARNAASPLHRLRADHFIRNALFLFLSVMSAGLFGFAFWLICAHLFSSADIGRAATLIAAASVIAYTSDLGLSSTLIRVLPTAPDPNAEINSALIVTGILSLLIAGAYVAAIPLIAPKLGFLRSHPLEIAAFVLLTACGAANLLTDSVFIAFRQTQYNFLVDGLLLGVTKLVSIAAVLGLGAFGIFTASGMGLAVALGSSLILMVWRVEYRPKPAIDFAVLLRSVRFSAANYVSSVFQLLPLLCLPILILSRLGPASAGYFYIAFSLANLAYAVSFSLSTSLFAEGSQHSAKPVELARRTAKLLIPINAVIVAVLVVGSHWLLLLYGIAYSRHATGTLVVLMLALPAVSINNVGQILLKLSGQVAAIVVVNMISLVVVIGLAVLTVSDGLVWVAQAWLIGNLVAGCVAVLSWRPNKVAGPSTGDRLQEDAVLRPGSIAP
jgi:O-antigen/teichoic acid export membrane protein